MNKYKLPPNHELFVTRTLADLQLEMLEDLAQRREELRVQLEEREANTDTGRILDQINVINEVFDDQPEVWDPLIDKWEKELAEGKIPNLDERLEEE